MRAFPFLNGLLALIAGLAAAPCTAQDPARTTTLPVEWITVDDGLPQGMVRAIVQDRTGYLWFATKDGLARSDGYGYTVFRHDARDTSSISANNISALYEDHAGLLWIGADNGAVDRYDPRTGVFAQMMRPPVDAPGSGQAIHQFAEDRAGHVLARVAYGSVRLLTDVPNGDVKNLAQDVVAMAFAPNDELWYLTSNALVAAKLQADLSATVLQRMPMPSLLSKTAGLFADTDGSRMLIVRDDHVLACDAITHRITDTLATGLGASDASNYVLDGRHVWFSLPGFPEAGRVALDEGIVEHIRFTEANGRSLPQGPLAYTFTRDRSGNLWVGTIGYGVLLHRALAGRFHRLLQGSSPWLQKADRGGREIIASTDMLWVNAPDGIPHPASFKKALDPTGRTPSWYGFTRDAQGVWWACVTLSSNTLLYHGPEPGDGIHPVTLGTEEEPLLLINCGSNDLWILANGKEGTPPDRLLRFDPIARVVKERILLPFELPVSDYRMVSALLFAKDGTMWMGTRKGLLQRPPGAKEWVLHARGPADAASLPSDGILSLCFDPDEPDRVIWVGTEEDGLARLDMRTGKCRRFGMKDGLPSNTIYSMLADAHRNLWVSTNSGLCRFDPRSGAARVFTRSDGLAGTEFNRYSGAISDDGRFFFAGTNGVTWFDPNGMYGEAGPSATVITGLALANKEVRWNGPQDDDGRIFHLPSAPDHLTSLTLPYAERSLTISFACMDHSVPHLNTFRYELEGFHNDWVEAGTTHQATFTNLDPGTYTFRVQGRNSADAWDEQGDALELIIAPPWWGTWWFRAAVLLSIGGGLYAFYRYRLAQAMKVLAVRERIARDLHDEIGSTLSSVSLYSSVAQKKVADKAPEANELLGRISESTTQVLESINDIVWAVNADNDDMEHLVKRMIDHAVRMTETRECQLHFDHDPALRSLPLDMAARKNLYLVFKEAVNNAVKYSGCTELSVTLVRERSQIVLRIADNGRGFDTQHVQSTSGGGNGLPNMRKRAAELGATLSIVSAVGKGTEIELRFVPDGRSKSLDAMTDAPRATE